jgi:hypothetical protein
MPREFKNQSIYWLLAFDVAAWEQAILNALTESLVGSLCLLVLDLLEDFSYLLACPLKILFELCRWEVLLGQALMLEDIAVRIVLLLVLTIDVTDIALGFGSEFLETIVGALIDVHRCPCFTELLDCESIRRCHRCNQSHSQIHDRFLH